MLLEADDVVVRYGAATALDGVSLRVDRGEAVALVGPNGAGKTTLVKAVTKLVRLAGGSVRCVGRVGHVPEGRQLFPVLNVEDNLRLGAWRGGDRDPRRVYDVLPALAPLARRRAETLSGGEQQMVAVGRALMANPDLLIIDELSLGLAPIIVEDLAGHLLKLHRDAGVALLLVEQNVTLALKLCDRAYVIAGGRIVTSGQSEELLKKSDIRKAFLGEPAGGQR